MNIYPHDVYIPYTYFLMWSNAPIEEGNKYYGAEYGKGKCANPNNILSWEYHTSSKYVRDHIEKYGKPDIIIIHRTFTNEKECRDFEHWYLKRVKAKDKPDWLNKTDNIGFSIEASRLGPTKRKTHKHSEQTKANMRRPHTMTEKLKKHIDSLRGSKMPRDVVERIAAKRRGSKATDEARENYKKAAQVLKTCPHCGNTVKAPAYNAWHGNRCKSIVS